MEKKLYECWDCDWCGEKGVSKDESKCPKCSCPKGEHMLFYEREFEDYDDKNFGKMLRRVFSKVVVWFRGMIPKTYKVEVQEMNWRRIISVESYEWVSDSGPTLPPDAIEEDEPNDDGWCNVFVWDETELDALWRPSDADDLYYYKILRWVHDYFIETSGNDYKPYWGCISLETSKRMGQTAEIYKIVGVDTKNNIHIIEVDYDEYMKIEVGTLVTLKVKHGKAKVLFE